MLATVLENQGFGRGNRWLKLHAQGQSPLDHEPGTVVGLALRQGKELLRHAYTVSRSDADSRTLEFLIRVIPNGRMTPHLAALRPGAELQVSGRGGHPIRKEVDTGADGIVLVSTGTGIGPLYGFCQEALIRNPGLPITLLAGFREPQDACLQDALQSLTDAHPNFQWHFSLSRPDTAWKGLRGRVTEVLPDLVGPVGKLHFHLVGNGDMVVELYEALMLAGLKDERVTSEIYFNYPETPNRANIEALAARFRLS